MVGINPLLGRALLAALPLLGLTLQARSGFIYGALGGGTLLLATTIFLAVHFAIPEALHRLSYFLLFLIPGVIGAELFSRGAPAAVPLLWVSLSILSPPDLFRVRKKGRRILKKTLFVSLAFWGLLTAHGVLSDVLGQRAGILFFQQPGGSYFLLGLAVMFLKRL